LRYLLDTNAFSEVLRPNPDPAFIAWFRATHEDDLYVSVLTVGELARGAEMLPPGRRRSDIESAIANLLADYSDRILAIDIGVAKAWAMLSSRYKRDGVVVGAIDELMAATALNSDCCIVTRNVRHFEHCGCELLSPWAT
jgi:predicted nucleic acid-binding protein